MNKYQASDIHGTWSPLLLQIRENSIIDFHSIDDEIEQISAAGVSGIYAGTNSGEFFNITFSEYCRLVERVAVACSRAGALYQIGACHVHPYESLERVAVAADHNPVAIQIILPDWVETDRRGTLRFLKGCAKNARGHNLVLCNPAHAKTRLSAADFLWLADEIPELAGISVYGNGEQWYEEMQPVFERLQVFVSGQTLATGMANGAKGSYSCIAGMNPFAAQLWQEMILQDMDAGLKMEQRIQKFLNECIKPFMDIHHVPWHACVKFMAVASGWSEGLHQRLRWPYSWIPDEELEPVREKGVQIIPEFFQNFT